MNYTPEDGFPYYFELAKDEELQDMFSATSVFALLESISEEKANFRYSPGKWSIKQLIGHITDHERIKMFRAFQLSRKEDIELWGYDQNLLVENSYFDELTIQELVADLSAVRKASLSFMRTLAPDQLKLKGKARQYHITLEAFLRSVIGHERHHINILREKYL